MKFKSAYRIGFSLLLATVLGQPLRAQQKPNIILIMADDLGVGDLGTYGQTMIRTPNLDALANGGIRFTNYYSGSTVCAPSRETLLTGMHTGHTYIRGNFLTDEKEDPALPSEKLTIAEQLKKAGYKTGLIGKWGLGGEGKGPETQGFDYSYGYLDQIQAHNYFPEFLYENGKKVILEKNANGAEGDYTHHLFVQKTFDFLNTTKEKEPFFLYLPYTIPHGKHVIPDNSAYADKDWSAQHKNYASMISLLDSDIGRIVKYLKEKGQDKNTLIFFTSDNGANPGFGKFFKSNGIYRGAKTNLYEGGIRDPLIAYWPGKIKPAQVTEHIAIKYDFFSTISDIAGIRTPEGQDGISFAPTLLGSSLQSVHPFLFWEFYVYNYNWNKPGATVPRNWLDSRAVRFGKWKAVAKYTHTDLEGKLELYDLEIDPSETTDLAANYPDLVTKAKQIFKSESRSNAPFFPYQKN